MSLSDHSILPTINKRISARAKHLQIKITPSKGIEVVIPKRLPRGVNVDKFIESKRDWIMQHAHLAQQALQTISLPEAINLRFVNELWKIHYHPTQSKPQIITRPNQELVLLADQSNFQSCQKLLKDWLKHKAHDKLLPHLEQVSEDIGLPYQSATIRLSKTRWGSCSVKKVISLNAHLLFLPLPLANYIMIHELAHTIHLNHKKQFWKLVEKHDPNYRQHDKALRFIENSVPAWVLKTLI